MSAVVVRDAEGDEPVRVTFSARDHETLGSIITGNLEVRLSQRDADELTARLIERQLDRWRDPDTDGPAYASSGVATGLRAALAYLSVQYGESLADTVVESALEVWSDLPEQHAERITDAGWEVD